MATSTACPKCDSSVVRYSRRRRKDGLLRLLFYSAFRCELCGHRHYRFKLLAVAGTVAVVLLITSFFGVANMVSKPYEQPKAQPLASRQPMTR